MSLRGEILGWVIGHLDSIDAADPVARHALFGTLRAQVAREGAFGATPEAALAHLESAIVRQEAYWLRETGQSLELAPPEASSRTDTPAQEERPRTIWRWPAGLKISHEPPGPPPGEAIGPFSDHEYSEFTLMTPSGPEAFRLNWTFDPACQLAAECERVGFQFRTRASNLGYAIGHLEAVLQMGGLSLPEELRELALRNI
ncbi:MAG: hypothetical protein ACK4MQ_09425 [Hyphomonas sp.]